MTTAAAHATSNGVAGSDSSKGKPPTSPSASVSAGGATTTAAGAGLPRPSGVVRSATFAAQPPSPGSTSNTSPKATTSAGGGGGHGAHRRVYSAVEGSLAQQALLEGTAGLVLDGNLDLSGLSLGGGDGVGSAAGGVGGSAAVGSDKHDEKDAKDAAGVTSWNELAQAQGDLLKSDHEAQARQEEEAALFAREATGGEDVAAEEDAEVLLHANGSSPKMSGGSGGASGGGGSKKVAAEGVGTPARGGGGGGDALDELSTPKTVGGTLVPLDADGRLMPDTIVGTPTPGLPPLSSSSTQPSRPPSGTDRNDGGMSVTSSTRSIPGSLVRPSGIDTTGGGGTTAGATAAASRAYSDIIEDEKADHRDTEDLEGLSIGYDGNMMEDDDNNSIISGVTTWRPLADAVGGGGIEGGDEIAASRAGRATSRDAPLPASTPGRPPWRLPMPAPVVVVVASAHVSASGSGVGGLTSALLRRSSATSSKDNGESGYVSSASGGAVSNDAFLQAMRAGAAGGGGGGSSAHHRVTASSVTDRTSGGGSSARKSARRHHHHHQQQPHHPHGRAHSPSARDTQSPLSLDELPVTPTRTGGSIQGSPSTLGTFGGGGGVGVGAAPFASSSTAAAAPASSTGAATATGSGGGGTSDLLLNAINDLRGHVDRTLDGVRDQNRSDFEKVLAIMQNESSKWSALESRLHAQLLLQSEAVLAIRGCHQLSWRWGW